MTRFAFFNHPGAALAAPRDLRSGGRNHVFLPVLTHHKPNISKNLFPGLREHFFRFREISNGPADFAFKKVLLDLSELLTAVA